MTHSPTKLAVVLGLALGLTLSACNKSSQSAGASASAAPSETASDAAAASSAEAAAAQPAAGTVANAKGDNTKSGPPSVNVAEEVQSRGDEAHQDLRAKVEAAQKAGRAPTDADVKKSQ